MTLFLYILNWLACLSIQYTVCAFKDVTDLIFPSKNDCTLEGNKFLLQEASPPRECSLIMFRYNLLLSSPLK